MNETEKNVVIQFAKELSVLHHALTFGALAMLMLIYFLVMKGGHFSFTGSSDIFLYVCPILAIGGVFGGIMVYKSKIGNIDQSKSLVDKLADYRAASIARFALAEGPALICVVAAMQTNNLLYLMIGGIMILYLYSMKVSEHKIIDELGL